MRPELSGLILVEIDMRMEMSYQLKSLLQVWPEWLKSILVDINMRPDKSYKRESAASMRPESLSEVLIGFNSRPVLIEAAGVVQMDFCGDQHEATNAI